MNEMNIGIQQNLKQELRMTPEMLQSIRILQMNHVELAQLISQEMLENPVLEEAEPRPEEAGMSADELRDRIVSADEDRRDAYDRCESYGGQNRNSGSTADFEKFVRQEETLQEHLMEQLRASGLGSGSYRACEYMIGNLDDDGYLTYDEEEIEKEAFANPWDVELALGMLQSMDPIGVGARNLPECLKIQLRAKNQLTESMERLIDEMLEDIAGNHIAKIASALSIRRKEAEEMVRRVRRLEPKPGRRFTDGRAVPYIVPDVIVERYGDQIRVYLNEEGIPELRISSYYRELVPQIGDNRELVSYLSDRFRSAEQLVRSVDQREQTILRVATAIVEHQQQFFRPGDKFLRPMTMHEIADELGIHTSTVSRAIDGKYMQIDGNIFSLRHFFGSGVSVSSARTKDGKAFEKDRSANLDADRIRDARGEPGGLRTAQSAKSGIESGSPIRNEDRTPNRCSDRTDHTEEIRGGDDMAPDTEYGSLGSRNAERKPEPGELPGGADSAAPHTSGNISQNTWHDIWQGTPAPDADASPDEISAASVRRMIRNYIKEEDPAHPLSDRKIADLLHADGIQISRRTVAKYREAEGIEATSRRKRV